MKKLLIQIKANERLPADNRFYLTQAIYDNGLMASHEYRRYDRQTKQWEDSLKISTGEKDLIWYKELSEEEYLQQKLVEMMPSEEEINKESSLRYNNSLSSIAESIHGMAGFNEGAKWMRSRLTQEE